MKLPTDKKERETVLKYIYDYATNVNWDSDKLEELAKNLNATLIDIKSCTTKYVREFLDNDAYKNHMVMMSGIRKKEKEHRSPTLKVINPILLKEGISTYKLWENDRDKEIVLKYIYNYAQENIYDDNKLEILAKSLGISVNDVKFYAKRYALDYLDYTETEYSNKITEYGISRSKLKASERSNIAKIYNLLLNAKNLDEIINIVDKSNTSLNRLKYGIADFVNSYKNGDEKIKLILEDKLNSYSLYLNKKKESDKNIKLEKDKQDTLPIALKTINAFINSDTTIDRFCKQNNINISTFHKYVNLVKEKNHAVANLYQQKIDQYKKDRYLYILNFIKNLVKCLKEGIIYNDKKRDYDIIDYYMSTNINLEDILDIAKGNVSNKDYNILRRFVNDNIKASKTRANDIKQIMDQKVITSYKTNTKGNIIEGSEVVFSNDEKQKIIDFLNNNNIPVNLKTYSLMYKRYKDNLVVINKKK